MQTIIPKQAAQTQTARRVISLWLNRFATDRIRRREAMQAGQISNSPALLSEPLVTVRAERGGWTLAALNDAAAVAGLRPGLPLADARALCLGLKSVEADPAGDRRVLEALTDSCRRYTPWAANDPGVDGIWLDISGCGHLFGGEDILLTDLTTYLQRLGYAYRLGVADTPGAAWAVARFGGEAVSVIPSGAQASILAPLPAAALRLSRTIVEDLHRMGLRRIEDIIGIPRAPLAARFGSILLERLDQALGTRPETITPRRPVPEFRARLAFAEPISHRNGIDAVLDRLLKTLCKQLADAHLGARLVTLEGYRTDGTIAEVSAGTGRPVHDPVHLARLFREKLETFDPGFGIDVAVLGAVRTDTLPPVQAALEKNESQTGCDDGERLDYLLDRLGNRLGPQRVIRLASQARHVPEKAAKAVSALLGSPPDGTDEGGPRARRPLRLLPSPEPIQVMAPVPDRPPVLFRWRRRPHRVAHADGPERIAPEWWLEDADALFSGETEARDYYRIEDEAGARFWVYREGLYRPDRAPRWYLHGFFA